jgi:hypothetical protein
MGPRPCTYESAYMKAIPSSPFSTFKMKKKERNKFLTSCRYEPQLPF